MLVGLELFVALFFCSHIITQRPKLPEKKHYFTVLFLDSNFSGSIIPFSLCSSLHLIAQDGKYKPITTLTFQSSPSKEHFYLLNYSVCALQSYSRI